MYVDLDVLIADDYIYRWCFARGIYQAITMADSSFHQRYILWSNWLLSNRSGRGDSLSFQRLDDKRGYI